MRTPEKFYMVQVQLVQVERNPLKFSVPHSVTGEDIFENFDEALILYVKLRKALEEKPS